jgi:hypothetical protein
MNAIKCPSCGKLVDDTQYAEHIKGDATNGPHILHTINIPGMGGPEIVQSNPKGPVFLDIPYLGRLRRDAFLAWSLIMFILGILMAGYYWRTV